MQPRARGVLAASLALLALSATLASSAPSKVQQAQSRPNLVVHMTHDHTVESMRVKSNVKAGRVVLTDLLIAS